MQSNENVGTFSIELTFIGEVSSNLKYKCCYLQLIAATTIIIIVLYPA